MRKNWKTASTCFAGGLGINVLTATDFFFE